MVLEVDQRQQLQTRASARAVAVGGPAASGAQIILPLANAQTREAMGVLPGGASVAARHWCRRLARAPGATGGCIAARSAIGMVGSGVAGGP